MCIKNNKKYKKKKNKTEDMTTYMRLYMRRRRKKDTLFRFANKTRSLVYQSFVIDGYKEGTKMHKLLGCDWKTFKNHIESKFKDGMSWDNFADIHIDHITPLITAKTKKEIVELNHYTNLQPLWAVDNLKKGSKVI